MIYVFMADGFEEIEAVSAIDILRRAGYNVSSVGVNNKEVKGAHKIKFLADVTEDELVFEDIEAIVLPGGMPGVVNLEKSNMVKKCVDYCVKNKKIIAAICAAPSILGHLGVLVGKKATCYPGFEGDLIKAEICKELICVDENIITAKGAGVALEFALKIVEVFSSVESASQIRMELQCK